jgi:hypothetical protein
VEHEKTPKNAIAKRARREVIARGLIEQKTPSQLATTLNISRETVYQEIRNPETQSLIRSWMEPHHAAIKRMIPRALAAVNKGLKPSQETRDRLKAVETLGKVMAWAQGDADDSGTKDKRFSGQLIELLALYAQETRISLPPNPETTE